MGRNIISSLNLSLAEDPVAYEEPLCVVEELAGLAPRPGLESQCVKKVRYLTWLHLRWVETSLAVLISV